MPKQPRTLDDFLARTVRHGECLLWTGALHPKGYARIGGQRVSRLVMALTGRVPAQSDLVLHSCDRPSCINPQHLSLGTAKENNLQKAARLSVNPRPKRVTAALVANMRRMRADGMRAADIAKTLGVNMNTVQRNWNDEMTDSQLGMNL